MENEIKNTFSEIEARLKDIEISEEDSLRINKQINLEMQKFRRDYQRKEKESATEAANIVLTS